jgi:hypothetical protein
MLAVTAGAQSSKPVTAQTLMSKLKRRSVGPYIGGRVITVAGVPGTTNVFYAGAVGGGRVSTAGWERWSTSLLRCCL